MPRKPHRPVRHQRRLFVEQLETRCLLAVGPVAAEFPVDLFTGDFRPNLVQNALGDTVVIWSHNEQESFARFYNPDGTERGPARQLIETPDSYRQQFRDVAQDDAGNFFALYHLASQMPGLTTPDGGLYVQRFDVLGNKLGAPIVVVEHEASNNAPEDFPHFIAGQDASIAANGKGSFVVVFRGAHNLTPSNATSLGTSEKGILARRFSASGRAAGEPFFVQLDQSPFSGSVFSLPDVAMDQFGNFTVIWEDRSNFNAGTPANVEARRYDQTGVPLGSSFVVGTSALGNEPAISMAEDGTFVITWVGQDGEDFDFFGVFAQAFSEDGDAILAEPLSVNTETAGSQKFPTVEVDVDANGFLIAWSDYRDRTSPVGTHGKIEVQQYRFVTDVFATTTVEPVGGNFLVNPSAASGQGASGSLFPAISGNNCGDLTVAWVAQSGTNSGIWARRFGENDPSGRKVAHDSDGDALPDCWELAGVTVKVDGVDRVLPLPEMGANPLRQDIFVEVDFMGTQNADGQPSGFGSHEPKDAAMGLIRRSFAKAPIMNLDGSTGITLHIDHGPHAPMHPGNDGIWNSSDDALWGDLSRADELAFVEVLGETDANNKYLWDEFDAIKKGPDGVRKTADDRFTAERWPAFHYAQFVHKYKANGSSGISRNAGGDFFAGASDFLVSLGGFSTGVGSVAQQAGTFMHEFGHNLGLGHGGGDHDNHKPNYLSVMNYRFQFAGLLVDSNGQGIDFRNHFDYSRFQLAPLNEQDFAQFFQPAGLSETAGLAGAGFDPSKYGTRYFCGPGNKRDWRQSTASIDWNCNTDTVDSGVVADVNGDGMNSFLTGFEDWSHLKFSGGGIGGLGAGLDAPASTFLDEATPDDFDLDGNPIDVSVGGGGTTLAAVGSSQTVNFVVQNIGTETNVFDLELTSLLGWAVTTGVPLTVSLAPNESSPISITVTVPAIAASNERDRITLVAKSQANSDIFDAATRTVELLALDFGDAPTAVQSGFASDYPVTLAANGARHTVGALFFGAAIDAEADGQPDNLAGRDATGGDDNLGAADEDGVKFLASLVVTSGSATKAGVSIVASGVGKLDAWIDFNRDGDWLDTGEQVLVNTALTAGLNVLDFEIPAGASAGDTAARFRLSTTGGLAPTGAALDGEVEDYFVTLRDGNAAQSVVIEIQSPAPGEIEVANDGTDVVVRKGATELCRVPGNTLQSLRLLGTDGDDAVAIADLEAVFAELIASDAGTGIDTLRLVGDGQELDLTQIADDDLRGFEIIDILGSGNNTLILNAEEVRGLSPTTDTLLVRLNAGDTARFGSGWTIDSPNFVDGEYRHQQRQGTAIVQVVSDRPWQNPFSRHDSNRDGTASPLDALVGINTLNNDGSRPLLAPTSAANLPQFYYDANGDNFISPNDVLQIINHLTLIPGSNSEGEGIAADKADNAERPLVLVRVALPEGSALTTSRNVTSDSPLGVEVEPVWLSPTLPQVPANMARTKVLPTARIRATELFGTNDLAGNTAASDDLFSKPQDWLR